MERKDILVWRKEHRSKKGLYHYKLYGKFDDVTVWEYLAVQLDLSQYRRGWDTTTAVCKEVEVQQRRKTSVIIEGDTPASLGKDAIRDTDSSSANNNSDNNSEALVYYWEVEYPAFFSNRSTIFQYGCSVFYPFV